MFDWYDANIDHIAGHNVRPEEAEEALTDPRRVGMPAYNTSSETRWAMIGATPDERLLFVVFTRRGRLIRVIMARDVDARERRRYRE